MGNKNGLIAGIVIILLIIAGGTYWLVRGSKAAPTSSPSPSPSASVSAAAAVNNAIVTTKTKSGVGEYLVNASGMTLYTYKADKTGVSNCVGSCLASWPAYIDSGATTGLPTNFGVIKRTDNSQMQYTYKGSPLYTFAADTNGSVDGNGVGNFVVAQP